MIDWDDTKFAWHPPRLDWNYAKRDCDRAVRLSMNGYIQKVLVNYSHQQPDKRTHSPAKRCTLLDYISTYSNDGIIYSASNMILSAHSGTGFNNELWWFLTLPAMQLRLMVLCKSMLGIEQKLVSLLNDLLQIMIQ